MALNPRDMDGFMPLLSSTDIKTKMTVGNNLLTYLGDSSNTIECQDIGLFIDNVIPWLGNGNAKVSVNKINFIIQNPLETKFLTGKLFIFNLWLNYIM